MFKRCAKNKQIPNFTRALGMCNVLYTCNNDQHLTSATKRLASSPGDDRCIRASDDYPWSYGLRLCIVTCQNAPIALYSDVRFHMTRSIRLSNGATALGSITGDLRETGWR